MAQHFVRTDQVAYTQGAPMRAAVLGAKGEYALKTMDGSTVLSGTLTPGAKNDAASGDSVAWADFTGTAPGRYRLELPEIGFSQPFAVQPRPYEPLLRAMLKGLYFMRCGCALEAPHAGPWGHACCHTLPAVPYGNLCQSVDVSGGWHDAGDYGKYVVPGATAVAALLLAFERRPQAFQGATGIPDSGGMPDVLREARWELQWMLRMQAEDGGVHHKTTTVTFPGFILPENDDGQWVVTPVSAAATADFAACLAMASRVYRPYDEPWAQALLGHALRAWQWMQGNPADKPFRNPKGVTTGEYGDTDLRDERLWATAALFRATGEQAFADAACALLAAHADVDKTGLGWSQVGGFAAAEALAMPACPAGLRQPLAQALLSEAQRLADLAAADGYRVPMAPGDYIWGSTMVLMNRAALLLLAADHFDRPEFVEVARDSLHWLLGRNPLSVCFVTGFGSNPVRHPHYRPAEADAVDEPVPGLVSGGPNRNRQDHALQKLLPVDTRPARMFVDDSASYSSNEVAIYWNTAAILVTAHFV